MKVDDYWCNIAFLGRIQQQDFRRKYMTKHITPHFLSPLYTKKCQGDEGKFIVGRVYWISRPERFIRQFPVFIETGNYSGSVSPEPVRVNRIRTVVVMTQAYLIMQVGITRKETGTSQCPDRLAAENLLPFTDEPFIEV